MKSEFDKGYSAGRFQAYQDAKMIFQGRIDRIEPGKDKRIKEALEAARRSVLHHLRSSLSAQEYPELFNERF
jgi:hypothetical protein